MSRTRRDLVYRPICRADAGGDLGSPRRSHLLCGRVLIRMVSEKDFSGISVLETDKSLMISREYPFRKS